MILFGIRSPLTVEYEETCFRCGIEVVALVSVNGTPRVLNRGLVVSLEDFDAARCTSPFLSAAFAPARRRALIEMGTALGLTLAPALIDPTATLARSVRVDDGSFINAGVVVGAVSLIGRGVLVNRAASLGHHTVLGDFVSVGPGATLAGNIHVGAGAMIGAGAVVLPDVRIGEGAIVAGGALVRRHVPDGAFVMGNPAKQRTFDPTRSSLNVEDGE